LRADFCARIGKRHKAFRARFVPLEAHVSYDPETPFDSIEGSQEYVSLLAEAIEEARQDVDADIAVAIGEGADRRAEALQLVSFKLAKLTLHIGSSRRILNDLRTLRRLLLAERQGELAPVVKHVAGAGV
jgi:hypothetical protein